ncbi:histidinol-phosphate transaminase [Azonexus sp.]|uniref:histidinol-phosphate transaminase n=1 Tax=Azonexus sp. TaxID=1872668 RepID=UPI0039E4F4B9
MSLSAQALPYVRAISPYQPGKPITELAREMGLPVERIVKLASNENPLGMSPSAQAAVAKALSGVARYPDQFELIEKLAAHTGLTRQQIVLGNGSNDVLEMLARVFLAPGRSAVFSQYAFAVYPLATQASGAEGIMVRALDYGHDLAEMLAAIRPDTRLVWIANPNNPTGNFLPYDEVRAFLENVPPDVVVVLDEAYNEYLPPAARIDTAAWIAQFPQLVVCRSFSKIYGLAGLRLGYAMASPEVADLLNRVRQPFNVNNLALVAAQAALDDTPFLQASYELNQAGLAMLVNALSRMGLSHIPSGGNFLTFRVGDAARVNQLLLAEGVIVRPLAAYGLHQHLRVSIGTLEENARFIAALEKVLEKTAEKGA